MLQRFGPGNRGADLRPGPVMFDDLLRSFYGTDDILVTGRGTAKRSSNAIDTPLTTFGPFQDSILIQSYGSGSWTHTDGRGEDPDLIAQSDELVSCHRIDYGCTQRERKPFRDLRPFYDLQTDLVFAFPHVPEVRDSFACRFNVVARDSRL